LKLTLPPGISNSCAPTRHGDFPKLGAGRRGEHLTPPAGAVRKRLTTLPTKRGPLLIIATHTGRHGTSLPIRIICILARGGCKRHRIIQICRRRRLPSISLQPILRKKTFIENMVEKQNFDESRSLLLMV
jgi:hypothetical protein